MNQRNKILLAVLGVQLLLIAVVYWPRAPKAAAVHTFFPGLRAAAIKNIAITDDSSGVIRLTRTGAGWTITDQAGTPEDGEAENPPVEPPVPADQEKVTTFLEKLTNLQSSRLVTHTRASQTRLQVAEAEFVRKIELKTEDGETKTLYLGSAPSFKTIHARAAGDSEVYLAQGLTSWEAGTELSTWWQTDYFDIEPAELQRVKLTNEQGSFSLARDAEGTWQLAAAPEGKALSTQAVDDFLNAVSYISLSDYLGRDQKLEKKHGLARPAATLTLATADQEITLRVGAEEKESDERAVKSSLSPFYVKAASYNLKPLLERKKEDLLAMAEAGNEGAEKTAAVSEPENQPE